MDRKRISFFVLFLFSICHLPASGQKPEQIDSLKLELAKDNPDTLRVQLLLSVAMKYQGFKTDSAMAYAKLSLAEAEALDYTKGRADALLHIGRLERDLDKAAGALDRMFTALRLYREIDDWVQIANSLNDISIIYANSGDNEKSLEYFKEALEIFQQHGDTKGESYALNNIGIMYQRMSDETNAMRYFLMSLELKKKNNDIYGISRGYTNLGSIAKANEQWDVALDYYFMADSLFEKSSDIQAQSENFTAIARIKDIQGKPFEAGRYARMGLESAKAVKSLTGIKNAAKLLAALEEKAGNYRLSLDYQKLYNQISDSLHNENHRATLEELKARFNVEEKEREISLLVIDQELQQARLEQKNMLTASLTAGIILMLLILGLVFYGYRTTKKSRDELAFKNKEIEQQKDDLDQLNKDKDRFFSILSHDLKGPLNSLRGLSYLLTDHLSSLTTSELIQVRTKIDTSLDNLIELVNNVLEWSVASSQKRKWAFERINPQPIILKNISLYKTIAESKGVKLIFEPTEEVFCYADYYAIDTVIRNLLSNSIKFSYPNKDVTIATSRDADQVRISVKDQGVGMSPDKQAHLFTFNGRNSQPGTHNEVGMGLGLTLCNELMRENKGSIHVKSKPGEGSEFIVVVPGA